MKHNAKHLTCLLGKYLCEIYKNCVWRLLIELHWKSLASTISRILFRRSVVVNLCYDVFKGQIE